RRAEGLSLAGLQEELEAAEKLRPGVAGESNDRGHRLEARVAKPQGHGSALVSDALVGREHFEELLRGRFNVEAVNDVHGCCPFMGVVVRAAWFRTMGSQHLAIVDVARYALRVIDLDALYREHAPAITASLARSFGARRLDLIEAAVQEAFVSAIESWGT